MEKDEPRPEARERRAPAQPAASAISDSRAFVGMDEGFRRSLLNLKNAIDSEMKMKETRVVLFTSSARGEGTTTIVSSLARVLALHDSQKSLLVDCALRDPLLHRLFGIPNEKGIAEYLAGRATLAEIVRTVEEGKLDLVTSGTLSGVAQPFFRSDTIGRFFKEVSPRYQYVLVDSSAVLESPETPIIGSHTDGVVLVVHAAKTRREVISRAMLMVQKLDGRFIGTVLNRKPYYIPESVYRRM